jgi:hypothetical protein
VAQAQIGEKALFADLQKSLSGNVIAGNAIDHSLANGRPQALKTISCDSLNRLQGETGLLSPKV